MSSATSVRASVVADCYDFFDRVFPNCGLLDLTEGIYNGRPDTPYDVAQANQHNWLLDEAKCGSGTRVLEIGCGMGTLLAAAKRRGAQAVGITISEPQVKRCRKSGLDARLLDYRDLPSTWNGTFDAIVANGSIEHFATPEDAAAGRLDEVYQHLFTLCHRLIKRDSSSRRFVTTVIHRHENSPRIADQDLFKTPSDFSRDSAQFHYAMLQRTFGGYYPEIGQLERCAAPHFKAIETVDGTEDYRLTSESAFARVRQALVSLPSAVKIIPRLIAYGFKRPRHCLEMTRCLLMSESWQYQFRGKEPPTRLLRHVWEYQA